MKRGGGVFFGHGRRTWIPATIETCQDLLQVKIALVACFEVLEELGRELAHDMLDQLGKM